MSATNRGSERAKSDFYPTPAYAIEALFTEYKPKGRYFLEPCAGNGSIVRDLKERFPNCAVDAVEILNEQESLNAAGADRVIIDDFLKTASLLRTDYTTIITNPPFTLALHFILTCLRLWPNAEIVMLLRSGFAESEDRWNYLFSKYQPSATFKLSKRPSFIKGGSDAASYEWYGWNTEQRGVYVLPYIGSRKGGKVACKNS